MVMPSKINCTIVSLALLLPLPLFSQQDVIAGRVIFASGNVIAELENVRSIRRVIRRSPIYTGDTIITSESGRTQLRMSDSALINLGCNSSLKIEEYSFEDTASNRATLRLLSGHVRTITGQIGKQNAASYRFLVNESRIEIRGTDFEVVLNENGNTYIGNYEGGITIVNRMGSVRLGIGGDVDFAVIMPGQAPKGLYSQPQQLGLLNSSRQSVNSCI